MNPWLQIKLSDYEGHMSMPEIAQSEMLAQALRAAARIARPRSAAVFGVAGGNGLDQLDPAVTKRVIALDINPDFVQAADSRFGRIFDSFEPHVHDLDLGPPAMAPVDFLFAGLLLEYLDWPRFVAGLPKILSPSGVFAAVLQMPNPNLPEVSDSPYRSLLVLEEAFTFVDPRLLRKHVQDQGFTTIQESVFELPSGKAFHFAAFRRRDLREHLTHTS